GAGALPARRTRRMPPMRGLGDPTPLPAVPRRPPPPATLPPYTTLFPIFPPSPAELLGTERMRELIGELRDAADMVIFDTPPVLNVTDAGVLAQRVDGVIYVICV